ncbi:MAG: transglycosylase SLT domain-containing protein [Pseudomonadota bacterium]
MNSKPTTAPVPLRSGRILVSAALLMVLWSSNLAGQMAIDVGTELNAQRQQFKQAWHAAGRGDRSALDQTIAALSEYSLLPYLQFERYRQTIGQQPASDIEQFLARYRDWSFASRLERDWHRALADRNDPTLLLRYVASSPDAEIQCKLLRARLNAGQTNDLADATRSLWLNGQSQPRACDPLFRWWRARGNPNTDDAWTRFGLAVEAGELDLARYLRRYLDDRDMFLANGWIQLAQRLNATLTDALRWPDAERSRQLIVWGLKRLASQDWQRAQSLMPRFESRFDYAPGALDEIRRRAVLFQAVDLDADAIGAIDALPESQIDQQMLEWRLRVSLSQSDWQNVLNSVANMSADEQLRGRWRYWRGRALAALGRPEAGLVYASLATEPHFYGFLAAIRAQQSLSICSAELAADSTIQLRLLRDAEFDRALELYRVGLHAHARSTWNRVSQRLSRAELVQAALLAAGAGWHDRAIFALGNAGAMRAYAWRFPVIERERIERYAEHYGVDPALIFGLMRAESAMQTDARSGANARGLLQLIDSTAREVSNRQNLPYAGPSSLYDPSVNIPLGIAHLGELQQRFEGDWTRVAAAYNAGITAATRWQRERPDLPADIWLETLPFFETRDYVPRVLAFATLYEYRLQQAPDAIAAHILQQSTDALEFRCADTQLDS